MHVFLLLFHIFYAIFMVTRLKYTIYQSEIMPINLKVGQSSVVC